MRFIFGFCMDSWTFGFGFIGFLGLRIWIYWILGPADLDSKSLPGLTTVGDVYRSYTVGARA